MAKPVIAIVGRPNVGKSTLFNKLVGKRVSIVDDTPGVTRDRIYGEVEWQGKHAVLIDTGGIEPFSNDLILSRMREQAELAIETSDVIIMVTDVKTGVTANDEEVTQMLLKSGKPIILCVNKCDKVGEPEPEFYEFYNLGLDPIEVSSVHGHGTGDLLDRAFELLPEDDETQSDDECISVALVGRPNAGKSSLINYILGEERCIVSDIAGTTRDSIDTKIKNEYGVFNFIDTAGIRRKSRVNESVEKYSVLRAIMAIDRCDVCIIMLDANEGIAEQDTKIAGMALDSGKPCIIAVNKWDAIEKDDKTMQNFKKDIERDFAFMSYTPSIFISAKTGQRVNKLFGEIIHVYNNGGQRIKTGMLNELLLQSTMRVQPPTDKGKRLKIYYMTQVSVRPPTFVFFVNNAELFHFSYQRYLENRLRDAFDFTGTPVRFIIREKSDK